MSVSIIVFWQQISCKPKLCCFIIWQFLHLLPQMSVWNVFFWGEVFKSGFSQMFLCEVLRRNQRELKRIFRSNEHSLRFVLYKLISLPGQNGKINNWQCFAMETKLQRHSLPRHVLDNSSFIRATSFPWCCGQIMALTWLGDKETKALFPKAQRTLRFF